MLIAAKLERTLSSCLSRMLLGIQDVCVKYTRLIHEDGLIIDDLGLAMKNHTLMHHTLGTGEFGCVSTAVT